MARSRNYRKASGLALKQAFNDQLIRGRAGRTHLELLHRMRNVFVCAALARPIKLSASLIGRKRPSQHRKSTKLAVARALMLELARLRASLDDSVFAARILYRLFAALSFSPNLSLGLLLQERFEALRITRQRHADNLGRVLKRPRFSRMLTTKAKLPVIDLTSSVGVGVFGRHRDDLLMLLATSLLCGVFQS